MNDQRDWIEGAVRAIWEMVYTCPPDFRERAVKIVREASAERGAEFHRVRGQLIKCRRREQLSEAVNKRLREAAKKSLALCRKVSRGQHHPACLCFIANGEHGLKDCNCAVNYSRALIPQIEQAIAEAERTTDES